MNRHKARRAHDAYEGADPAGEGAPAGEETGDDGRSGDQFADDGVTDMDVDNRQARPQQGGSECR